MILKTFRWAFAVTALGLAVGVLYDGWAAFGIVAILAVLEISLSFDNAVVNAKIIERMNAYWQKIFLTIGILIAVFGMRLLFPLLIVGLTADLNPLDAIQLAREGGPIEEEGTYAYLLHAAHPDIAAFGGMFLLLLFLDFIFDPEREITWLSWLEKPLGRIGKLDQLSVVVGLIALVVAAKAFAENEGEVLFSGILGVTTYILVGSLGELFEGEGEDEDEDEAPAKTPAAQGKAGPNKVQQVSGKAAFFLFLYLEVLDASFSFDGVIGAFAITQNIFIIAVGLGVGAMYIRSLTVYLVRKGTLGDYVYLEHGAMWAIGALAAILLVSIKHEVPEVVTGLIGVGFIGLAFLSSLAHNKRHGGPASSRPQPEPVKSGT